MNVVLIGFKACGKSATGRALASLTGKSFIDTDALVERLCRERSGRALSCRDIVRRHGQNLLRDLETESLRQLAEVRNAVIATGGGIVLREENPPLLRKTGVCVFLDTPLPELEKRLASQADSPLFKERSVRELYQDRYPLYLKAADLCYVPQAGEGPESVAEALWRVISDEKSRCIGGLRPPNPPPGE